MEVDARWWGGLAVVVEIRKDVLKTRIEMGFYMSIKWYMDEPLVIMVHASHPLAFVAGKLLVF